MIVVLGPLLIMLIGLLMYVLAANPKVQEIGRIMFFCGLLALMFSSSRWEAAGKRYGWQPSAARLV